MVASPDDSHAEFPLYASSSSSPLVHPLLLLDLSGSGVPLGLLASYIQQQIRSAILFTSSLHVW
jgi:hypothetical protein